MTSLHCPRIDDLTEQLQHSKIGDICLILGAEHCATEELSSLWTRHEGVQCFVDAFYILTYDVIG